MDQSETEPERSRQVPTLVWLALGALLVAGFAAAAILLGGPSGGLPTIEPPANQADQTVLAGPEPEASRLD